MARTREFDTEQALNKAIELFWQQGYAHTSMRQMVKHTGVSHAGLYTAFGGKDELFLKALRHYQSNLFAYLFSGICSPKASLKEIYKLFAFITTAKDDHYFKYGCFIANTAIEFGAGTGAVQEVILNTYQRQESAFAQALRNAKRQKLVPEDLHEEHQAAKLTALFYGCTSLTRMNAPSASIQAAVDQALCF